MLPAILKSESIFNKAIAVSIAGHILFLSGVCLTFNNSLASEKSTVIYFLGPLLARSDLSYIPTNRKIYPLNFKTIYQKQASQPVSSSLGFSSNKPAYPSQAIPSDTKRLDKFLVAEKKAESQNVKPGYFEPPRWEKVELRLKSE